MLRDACGAAKQKQRRGSPHALHDALCFPRSLQDNTKRQTDIGRSYCAQSLTHLILITPSVH